MLPSAIMSDPSYLLLLVGALFVHMSYQLSVSVLTHFSSHMLSRQVSDKRLLGLGISYSAGVIVTIALLLTALASLTSLIGEDSRTRTLAAIAVGAAPFIGLLTMLWYYRRGDGTRLWLPRPIATYLLERSKKTQSDVEAIMLGAATVLGELPFLIGPLLFVTYGLTFLPATTWFSWSCVYGFLASLPLIVVTMYLTSGHSIARIQRWREENKTFLQWTSGIALIFLTIYLTVIQLGGVS